MKFFGKLSTPWAIVTAGALVAVAIYASSPATLVAISTVLTAVFTGLLAAITYFYARSQRQVEWFMGAMENHSHQQRLIAAKQAGIKVVWWDKTHPEANNSYPFDGKHNEEAKVDIIYVGIPLAHRLKQPSVGAKWIFGDR